MMNVPAYLISCVLLVPIVCCCPAAKEFFTVTKPERDNTVANRLIGAALGIRITSTKPVNTDIASRKPRAPSPPREDAWDD